MAISNKKAWIVAVSMGYGHQRAAYPLAGLAPNNQVINANDYPGIPENDRKIWERARSFYELISRFYRVPIIGKIVFGIFDRFQAIQSFYPKRDLSKPTFQLKQTYSLIQKGWGRDQVERLNKRQLPLIATFFIPAFMAEFHGYKGDIYCLVADADVSRAWAALKPRNSRIKYFAPTQRVAERLKLYGVRPGNIFYTGFPLPRASKNAFRARMRNLGPASKKPRFLTLMFAVGGAGAQKEIAIQIAESLSEKIKAGKVGLILSAGIRQGVKDYFVKELKQLGLEKQVKVLFEKEISPYFQKFNEALKTTDILWTKPSELSFYSALGLPILIAPPIGSQEEFNKSWLLKNGFGIEQGDPAKTDQWLFDWLAKGYFADCAEKGFAKGEKSGISNITKICFG
ncbi:MAG: hypothetical protein HYT21_02875 [Candidatus Nealsonbacteria bacterium]|nr:hypothetical protein [Candidatus Nealsonbacteria bacterium]